MTAVVIPARAGSKGIPNKNIREIDGQPLISYSILDGLRMKDIDGVYVSTDSIKIAKVAEKYGAETPFKRPAKYCKDDSPDIEWARHFLAWHKVIRDTLPDYLVHLRATTPLRDTLLLDRALTTLKTQPQASSLRSVELFPESPYKWIRIDNRGYFEPLLGEDKDAHIKPRQNYPNVYRPNGYIDIYKTETILGGSLCGDKIIPFITPLSIEIDNEETFRLAEIVLKDRVDSID